MTRVHPGAGLETVPLLLHVSNVCWKNDPFHNKCDHLKLVQTYIYCIYGILNEIFYIKIRKKVICVGMDIGFASSLDINNDQINVVLHFSYLPTYFDFPPFSPLACTCFFRGVDGCIGVPDNGALSFSDLSTLELL